MEESREEGGIDLMGECMSAFLEVCVRTGQAEGQPERQKEGLECRVVVIQAAPTSSIFLAPASSCTCVDIQ